jgi:hypothetical protein
VTVQEHLADELLEGAGFARLALSNKQSIAKALLSKDLADVGRGGNLLWRWHLVLYKERGVEIEYNKKSSILCCVKGDGIQ